MKPKSRSRIYVQGLLFGGDEMRAVERSCPRREYGDYWRGAVDMFLALLQTMPEERRALRNINRPYMEAVCRAILKDRRTLAQFQQGAAFTFAVTRRDEYGRILQVQAKPENPKTKKNK